MLYKENRNALLSLVLSKDKVIDKNFEERHFNAAKGTAYQLMYRCITKEQEDVENL